MYISRALLYHGYFGFSLAILEYVDISNLSLEQAKKLIVAREQFYIDSLEPAYNLLSIAGSRLGSKHTEESIVKMNVAKSGENHPMFGKFHSEETLIRMSEAKSGDKHPRGMLGKTHSAETLAKMSEAKSGENHPIFMGP